MQNRYQSQKQREYDKDSAHLRVLIAQGLQAAAEKACRLATPDFEQLRRLSAFQDARLNTHKCEEQQQQVELEHAAKKKKQTMRKERSERSKEFLLLAVAIKQASQQPQEVKSSDS